MFADCLLLIKTFHKILELSHGTVHICPSCVNITNKQKQRERLWKRKFFYYFLPMEKITFMVNVLQEK